MTRAVDPITAEVVSRHLLAVAEEMAVTLIRTAFSPNIKERADCSSAVFDKDGQVVAQAHRVPIHLGSMIGAIDELKQRFGSADIRPGDMFIANDPYSGGGSHLPDINVIAPVFWRDDIVAYVANIAHHADVGGMLPGSEAAVCKTIFQEGLRLPLVRIMRAGELNRDLLDIIQLNSRTPDERAGDLRAQFAANLAGIRSVISLFERYGDSTEAAIVLGGPTTFSMIFATSKFRTDNPKTYAAFFAAFGTAIDEINSDKPRAAKIYLEMTHDTRSTPASILAMLNEPHIVFTTTPQRRHRARSDHPVCPADATKAPAVAAAALGARPSYGVVHRHDAELAAAAVPQELSDNRARTFAGTLQGGRDPRQPRRPALHGRIGKAGV